MSPRASLRLGLLALCASSWPLLVEIRWNVRLAPPPLFGLAALHVVLALWTARGGRLPYLISQVRSIAAVLLSVYALGRLRNHEAEVGAQLLLCAGLSGASFWLLGRSQARELLRERREVPRAVPAWGAAHVGLGLGGISLLLGPLEQWLLYAHISVEEVLARSGYLLLPIGGAWLLGRRGGVLRAGLGAFAGDLLGDLLSRLISGAGVDDLLLVLLLPIGSLGALPIGLALGALAPRSPASPGSAPTPIGRLLALPVALGLATVLARWLSALWVSAEAPSLPSVALALVHGVLAGAVILWGNTRRAA